MEKTTRRKTKKRKPEIKKPRLRIAGDESKGLSLWMEKSMYFVSAFPTITEIREELGDWRSFEPLDPRELSMS